jgi:glutathione S-transferase
MYHLTALVTLLTALFYFLTALNVAKLRGRTGVKVPAMSGHPDFERAFRIQLNTLEWLPIFLPSLWLFAIYIGDSIAAAIGAVWIIGRIVYAIGYSKDAIKRRPGFLIQALATVALWLGALGAVAWRLAH